MRVAGCGGATGPGAGESDWGRWDCAAASRTGCPSGLAVETTRRRRTKHTGRKTGTGSHATGQGGVGKTDGTVGRHEQKKKKAREGGTVEGRQQRSESRHKKFSPVKKKEERNEQCGDGGGINGWRREEREKTQQ